MSITFWQKNSLVESLKLARHCNQLGIEARVVVCLTIFELPVPIIDLKIPVDGLYFYVEALNTQYGISGWSQTGMQRLPEELVRLGKFKMLGSKTGSGN
ncbi:MAG: hypothetical protein ABSA18_11805 [Dehalococcoidia bacterium]|jgi:hypothetical protein